jgi:hypothetical protein
MQKLQSVIAQQWEQITALDRKVRELEILSPEHSLANGVQQWVDAVHESRETVLFNLNVL